MDQVALVEGGTEGLLQIMRAFQERRLPVEGVYLITFTSDDDFVERIIRLIVPQKTHALSHQMITELVKLRRENALPSIDPSIRFSLVSRDDLEASRVIDYGRRIGVPNIIRDVMWKGLFIEYAMVAKVPDMAAV